MLTMYLIMNHKSPLDNIKDQILLFNTEKKGEKCKHLGILDD